MERFYITTTDRRRLLLWQRLFGSETVPVLSDRPRWQESAAGETVLAYDLALAYLHRGALWRLASYISSRYGMDYHVVLLRLETAVSWPLVAGDDVVVVETAVDEKRPFPSFWQRLTYRIRSIRSAINPV